MLDSDGDGLISAQKIDISVLTPEILEVFTPLFCEMEELGQTLDIEEFVDASKRLFDTLTIPERDLVLAISDKWQTRKVINTPNYSFEPHLNHNSMKIAAKNRIPGEDIANVLYEKHNVSFKILKFRELSREFENSKKFKKKRK